LPSFRNEVLLLDRLPGAGAVVVAALVLVQLPVAPVLANIISGQLWLQIAAALGLLLAPLLATSASLGAYSSEGAFAFWYLCSSLPAIVWLVARAPSLAARQRKPWVGAALPIALSFLAPAAYWCNVEWLHLGARSPLVPHLALYELFDPELNRFVLVGVEAPRSRRLWVEADEDQLEVRFRPDKYESPIAGFWQVGMPQLVRFGEGADWIFSAGLLAERSTPDRARISGRTVWVRKSSGRVEKLSSDLREEWWGSRSRWTVLGPGRWAVGLVGGDLLLVVEDGEVLRTSVLAKDFLSFPVMFPARGATVVKLGKAPDEASTRLAILFADGRLIETDARMSGTFADQLYWESEGDGGGRRLVLLDCEGIEGLKGPRRCVLQRVELPTGNVVSVVEILADGRRFGSRFFERSGRIYAFSAPEKPLAVESAVPVGCTQSHFMLVKEAEESGNLVDAEGDRSLRLRWRGKDPRLLMSGRWLVVVSDEPSLTIVDSLSWASKEVRLPEELVSGWYSQAGKAPWFADLNSDRLDASCLDLEAAARAADVRSGGGEGLVFQWTCLASAVDRRAASTSFALLEPESGVWLVPPRTNRVERWLEID